MAHTSLSPFALIKSIRRAQRPLSTTNMAATQRNPRMLQFKLVLLGESAVGKSSLVLRFVKDQFDDYRESTIGGKHAFNAHSNL